MAKEQKRGNKEARKPKGDKKKSGATAGTASVSSLMANSGPVGRLPKAKS